MTLLKKRKSPDWYALLNKDFTLRQWPKEEALQELDVFIALQKTGMNASEAVRLAFRDSQKIVAGLESGMDLQEILSARDGWQSFGPLCQVLSMEEALDLMKTLSAMEEKTLGAAFAKMAYPAFLLAGTLAVLLFFESCILPVMAEFLLPGLALWFALFKWVLMLGMGAVVVLAGLVVLGLRHRGRGRQFVLVKKVHTIRFLELLSVLEEKGIPTCRCLELLDHPFSGPVGESLQQGADLVQACRDCAGFDPEALAFLECGLESGRTRQLIAAYGKKGQHQVQVVLKQWVQTLTACAYGTMGLLAILVYQVLLAPMDLLSTL